MSTRGADISPQRLAAVLTAIADDLVVGLDVDGVLAPIVDHADEACVLAGVNDVLSRLGERLAVAVVSGRSLENLKRQFAFPEVVEVIGSHGLEWRSGSQVVLDDDQRALLDQVTALADQAVEAAGTGAWRETKPTSVVVHVRQAEPARAKAALDSLRNRLPDVGIATKEGHAVVELMVVDTSKATAMQTFCQRHGATRMAFVGDDLTDEEVFRAAGPSDVTVRVGGGQTEAAYRLADPEAVLAMLVCLADAIT